MTLDRKRIPPKRKNEIGLNCFSSNKKHSTSCDTPGSKKLVILKQPSHEFFKDEGNT